jgi:flagellar basal-body rod protein FlgC
MDMMKSIDVAASALSAQSERLKVIAQNIANADSVASTPGGTPYQRKTISFKNVLDKKIGLEKVEVSKIGVDKSEFDKEYDPANPAADAEGYVLKPNVSTIVEMTDMKEARNAYQANLSVIEIAKSIVQRTLELLRV